MGLSLVSNASEVMLLFESVVDVFARKRNPKILRMDVFRKRKPQVVAERTLEQVGRHFLVRGATKKKKTPVAVRVL